MLSVLPSIIVLGLAALAALALNRQSPPGKGLQRHAAARALAVTTGIQGIHFAEEAATGFHERFPTDGDIPDLTH